jgi:hypothetical protein
MHILVWLHLENSDVFYSPSSSVFAPTSSNMVATRSKSEPVFRIASQKAHPLDNLQIDASVGPEPADSDTSDLHSGQPWVRGRPVLADARESEPESRAYDRVLSGE